MRENVMKLAEGLNDEYGQSVLRRLQQVDELCAADAQYHFRCMRDLHHVRKSTQTGKRTTDEIEGDFRPHPYTVRRHLLETFGDDIVVTSRTPYVVCFKAIGQKIITDNWFQEVEKLAEKEEWRHIVEAAAVIVVEDIRSQVNDVTEYPATDKFLNGVEDVIPKTLRVFIETVVLNKKRGNLEPWKKKWVAIAHILISRFGSFFIQKYGSRKQIDILSSLGFCATYNEATRFEVSSIIPTLTIKQQILCQMIYDNTDFNIQTHDGRNTFYRMGIIRCLTPKKCCCPWSKD
ncbi:unnamed protein product [Psylliodes chrysocephalus]|uniref:Uncharacterized protein n=1 Tax=Psylliodes chrysocephalus TaxID=3402493 RepID=A0A9P0G9Y3_9CUCU|nr:unnamed protein product [Psylliodes chrysocephala]